ncbi:p53 and DNA damage-regulated protein 1 [Fasciolopsis buskii]|uniref:p53 and DNA damage-regulated protein 1 n=1 Tax=Fasciolopsis buskii TaxID=27845 RepID=A0A8E0RNZ4_9TREM|nr:p53 and DNA damage-regulated protein 1 [Fasciolopsis buski]
MALNHRHQKMLDHLTQIEEVGELILAKREQCVSCDKSRQKAREAIHALAKLSVQKQWTCLSNQFFLLPRGALVEALREDMRLYDLEIEKTRKQMKEDMKLLGELEDKESLKGFGLIALSKENLPQ